MTDLIANLDALRAKADERHVDMAVCNSRRANFELALAGAYPGEGSRNCSRTYCRE